MKRKELKVPKFGRGQVDAKERLRVPPQYSEMKSKGAGTSGFWKGKAMGAAGSGVPVGGRHFVLPVCWNWG